MSAINPGRIFAVEYTFINYKLPSGELFQEFPKEPKEILFKAITSPTPPGPPPLALLKLIDGLVRSFIFEKKCHLDSALKLTIGLSHNRVQFPLADNNLTENKNFISFVKENIFSRPCDESFSNETYIILDVKLLHPMGLPLGLSTGYLRYPHLLRDLWFRFAFDRLREDVNVCIIGPGLYKAPKLESTCPQFVEILALFEKATFTLLDVDPISLNAFRESFHNKKIALYDPRTLHAVTDDRKVENNVLCQAPDEYIPAFSMVKRGLASKTSDPDKTYDMLEGKGQLEPLSLKVDPQKIKINHYDAVSSEMVTVEGGYDVIVATHSISNAYYTAKENGRDFDSARAFGGILTSLKRGGALYLDSIGYDHIKDGIESKSQASFQAYIRTIETKLDTKFRIDTVPVTSYYKNAISNSTTSSFCLMGENHQYRNITCGSVVVMTRTFDKPLNN